jgi:hypothetical protein
MCKQAVQRVSRALARENIQVTGARSFELPGRIRRRIRGKNTDLKVIVAGLEVGQKGLAADEVE